MGRLAGSTVLINTTDALFRAWAQFVHDGLIAAGLLQASDTGQVNLTTMTAPVAINTYAGYEIFKFNDSLQATKPIFVKVEYGCSGNTGRPSIRFTLGPGTDGAGAVTAGWGTAMTPASTASSNTTHACWASGDGSAFVLSMWSSFTSATTAFQFFVERSRDENGDPTGDGLAFGHSGQIRIIAYSGTWSTTNCAFQQLLCPFPTAESTSPSVAKGMSHDGVTFPWIPVVFSCPGVPAWRSAVMLGVHPYDQGMGSIISVSTHGGVVRSYLQPGIDVPAAGLGMYTSTSNYYLSQIWEA